jgi:tetratricopeptide (TPR) repeat protein
MSSEVKKDIDSIAWLLKQAKDSKNPKPKPIVFLGAGASISAGIPGASQIVDDILIKFADKPEVKRLEECDKKDYYKLMACLTTTERHELLRGYIISEKVKTNVTHIYLAQMLKEGYVDYVLTVNFDDLFLRACALFNFIPPVYDISILNDFTTSTLVEKSITYLHGQHQGFWLLNTGDELKKVKDYVSTVLDRICHQRTWIVVGYSGQDPIFDQITRLGHFTDDLFWIGYNDHEPSENVKRELLDKANSNAYWIKGYNSDTFFLELHSKLKMETPEIFNKPFSFLKELLNNITDIKEKELTEEHQVLFDNVKQRLEVAKRQADAAVQQYEHSNPSGALSEADISRDQLKQKIIEEIVKEDYEVAEDLLEKIDGNDIELNELISELFFNWGVDIAGNAEKNNKTDQYELSVVKFTRAISLKPNNSMAYNNWGVSLYRLAKLTGDLTLNETAIEKYRKAIEFDENNMRARSNLAVAVLYSGAKRKDPDLLYEAIEQYKI